MSALLERFERLADLDAPVPYLPVEEPPAWRMVRTPVYACEGCGRSFRLVRHKAGGFCSTCLERRRGRCRARPGSTRRRPVPLVVVASEFNAARATGMTRGELARALGMGRRTLDSAIRRGRRAGLIGSTV